MIRIVSHRLAGRYRCKQRPANVAAMYGWPDRSTAELLGEAIGEDRFVTDVGHPIYRQLVEGQDLD